MSTKLSRRNVLLPWYVNERRTFQSALRELNPPFQLGRLAPLPLGQGHVIFQGGRRGSRTLKAHRSTVFKAVAVAHRLALPFRAAAAGIEPAIVSLTGSRLTFGPRRTKSRGRASNPRSPVPETSGLPAFLPLEAKSNKKGQASRRRLAPFGRIQRIMASLAQPIGDHARAELIPIARGKSLILTHLE